MATEAPAGPRRTYNLPRGDASTTLRQFAGLLGRQVLFLSDKVRGEQTNALAGDYTPREALDRLLASTNLIAIEDEASGGFVVSRRQTRASPAEVGPDKPQPKTDPMNPSTTRGKLPTWLAHLALVVTTAATAQQTDKLSSGEKENEVIELTPFTVTASSDTGYGALLGTTGRLATPYIDVPQSTSIITSEFLKDAMIFSNRDAVFFVPNVKSASAIYGGYVLRGISGGLSWYIDGTTLYGNSPLDVFFYDRIEIVKGPSTSAFGGADPVGFINHVSKKPQFKHGTEASVIFGTGNDRKNTFRATLDQQGFLSADRLTAFRFLAVYDDGAQSMNYYGNYRRSGAQMAVSHRFANNRGQLDVIGSYQTGRIPGSDYTGAYSNKYYFSALKYDSQVSLGTTNIPDFPLFAGNDVPGYERAIVENVDSRLTAQLTYKLSEHWDTRLAAAIASFRRKGDGWGWGGLINPTDVTSDGKITTLQYLVPRDARLPDKSVQADFVGNYDFEKIGTKLTILGGADRTAYSGGWDASFQTFVIGDQKDILTWDPYVVLPAYPQIPADIAGRGTGNSKSAYAQLQLKFFNEKLQLVAAERKTWSDVDYRNTYNNTVFLYKSHSPLLPTYSVLVKPRQWLSIYGTYAEFSRPPEVQKEWLISAEDEPFVPANDPIRSKRVASQPRTELIEFGAKASLFDGRLVVSLARYKMNLGGTYTYLLELANLSDGTTRLLAHDKETTTEVEGWELEAFGSIGKKLTYMFGAALGCTSNYRASYAGQLITSETPFFGDSLSGYLSYSFGPNRQEGLSITVGGKANLSGWLIGYRPKVPETTYGKTEYFLDLGASYGFKGGKYQVFVKGNNITHKDALPNAGSSQVMGRQIFTGITARF